jgi:RHS repeat-associated protein
MQMKERTFAAQEYTYGFNGQEQDGDLMDGAVIFKYRIHDPRIGRFLSVDPLAPEYPWNSAYAFAENQVIWGIDLEGREIDVAIHAKSYWNMDTKIDMTTLDEASHIIKKTGNSYPIGKTKFGYPRSNMGYWNTLLEQHPEMFSDGNKAKIFVGVSPVVDEKWIEYNPTHNEFKPKRFDKNGKRLKKVEYTKLVHHHIYQGKNAVAVPAPIHTKFKQVYHTFDKGNKYTLGMAMKFGKGKYAKVLARIGVVGSIVGILSVSQGYGSPVDILDPIGITFAVDMFLEQTDGALLTLAMKRGYEEFSEYAKNCIDCRIGIYYATDLEAMAYLNGDLEISNDLIEGTFLNLEDARSVFGPYKSFGIIFSIDSSGEMQPAGVLDMTSNK